MREYQCPSRPTQHLPAKQFWEDSQTVWLVDILAACRWIGPIKS